MTAAYRHKPPSHSVVQAANCPLKHYQQLPDRCSQPILSSKFSTITKSHIEKCAGSHHACLLLLGSLPDWPQ